MKQISRLFVNVCAGLGLAALVLAVVAVPTQTARGDDPPPSPNCNDVCSADPDGTANFEECVQACLLLGAPGWCYWIDASNTCPLNWCFPTKYVKCVRVNIERRVYTCICVPRFLFAIDTPVNDDPPTVP